ncbi:MAG: SagB/ThcOx family dehydrogenase [Actinobacteria bacterium]|nr:SagB/ThcOx family dehydrogenase [Actinomycetota bacterium]
MPSYESDVVELPKPRYSSDMSVEEALLKRRSVRRYKDEPLALAEMSQLLWAAQGITDLTGLRAAPSAGALYPLELYAVVGNVDGLADGIYKYKSEGHGLIKTTDGDRRSELSAAGLGQRMIKNAAIDIVFSAIYERTTRKYGNRGVRYVYMDVGFAAENVYLQAVTLGLGTVIVGAFDDDAVKSALNMPYEEHPLCIMPVGRV